MVVWSLIDTHSLRSQNQQWRKDLVNAEATLTQRIHINLDCDQKLVFLRRKQTQTRLVKHRIRSLNGQPVLGFIIIIKYIRNSYRRRCYTVLLCNTYSTTTSTPSPSSSFQELSEPGITQTTTQSTQTVVGALNRPWLQPSADKPPPLVNPTRCTSAMFMDAHASDVGLC